MKMITKVAQQVIILIKKAKLTSNATYESKSDLKKKIAMDV